MGIMSHEFKAKETPGGWAKYLGGQKSILGLMGVSSLPQLGNCLLLSGDRVRTGQKRRRSQINTSFFSFDVINEGG